MNFLDTPDQHAVRAVFREIDSRWCDDPSHHECTIVTRSGGLRVRLEWFRVPQPRLVLNSAKDVVDGDLEWSEVCINSLDFKGVSGRTRLGTLLVTIALF